MTKPNGMNIKEVAKAMQTIEFILFTVKNGDTGKLHAGEAENAHQQANKIMKEYLLPLGAFEEEEQKIDVRSANYDEAKESKIELKVIDGWNCHTLYRVSGVLEGLIEVQFDDEVFNGVILFSKDKIDCDEKEWEHVKDTKIYDNIKEKAIKDYNGDH